MQALGELSALLAAKNNDYRVGEGEFSNFAFASDVSGVSVEGIMISQIGIKLGRIKGLMSGLTTDVSFEPLGDSIDDLAGYAVLLKAWKDKVNG